MVLSRKKRCGCQRSIIRAIGMVFARTALIFPCCKAKVGLCVMKVPSTTGTNTNVPKNPLRLISTFAASRTLASTVRRQARVSTADEQLRSVKIGIINVFSFSWTNVLALRHNFAVQSLYKMLNQYESRSPSLYDRYLLLGSYRWTRIGMVEKLSWSGRLWIMVGRFYHPVLWYVGTQIQHLRKAWIKYDSRLEESR